MANEQPDFLKKILNGGDTNKSVWLEPMTSYMIIELGVKDAKTSLHKEWKRPVKATKSNGVQVAESARMDDALPIIREFITAVVNHAAEIDPAKDIGRGKKYPTLLNAWSNPEATKIFDDIVAQKAPRDRPAIIKACESATITTYQNLVTACEIYQRGKSKSL